VPELLELLKHPNVWYRREARQLLVERQDPSTADTLVKMLTGGDKHSLEALWTMYQCGIPFSKEVHNSTFTHADEYMRAWGVRLFGDDSRLRSASGTGWVMNLAKNEQNPVVLAQLACTDKHAVELEDDLIAKRLLRNPAMEEDPQLSLLLWWAIEGRISFDPEAALSFSSPRTNPTTIELRTTERIARRLMAKELVAGPKLLAALFAKWRDNDPTPLLVGMLQGLQNSTWPAVPEPLKEPLAELRKARPNDRLVLEILTRMRDPESLEIARKRATHADTPDAERIRAIELVRQIRDPESKEPFLALFAEKRSDAVKLALLAALEGYDDPKIGETVLGAYPDYSPAMKKRAVQLLLSRPAWAIGLFKALEAGKFPKADLTVSQARIAIGLGDKDVTVLVEKQFGKIAPATAGEKQARISWLNAQIPREKGADAARGKVLFTKHCAACHQFHGEGGKVGPDITTADRKNRGYMIAQIVDPSGYIRPEFVVQNVLTIDERKLSGIAKEVGESVELSNIVDNKPVVTVVSKKDIADIRPSAVSLMPEKILDTLSDAEIADLFAYLVSDAKLAPGLPGVADDKTPGKQGAKLKVALVSGSFEYKSDDSLALLQKHLEANYPVECVRIFAKAEKDTTFAGIENLEKCDVAIFFTRRLQIEGEALAAVRKFVESKKPIVGIRTASHGFQKWLEMDKVILGGDYQGHFGKGVADVNIVEKQKDHPILKGVAAFKTNGSLYKNPNVAADVVVLLQGSMGKESEPVAWTREKDGRRVFYTSLGHPDDFKDDNFTRLIVNGLAWATKTELKK